MLGSHNVLNPANGGADHVPSQDMVLGLYYITRRASGRRKRGAGLYGPEEAIIASKKKTRRPARRGEVHVVNDIDENGQRVSVPEKIATTIGRILFFNQVVPRGGGPSIRC